MERKSGEMQAGVNAAIEVADGEAEVEVATGRMRTALPYLLILGAAFCWGLIGIPTRSLQAIELTSLQIVFVRSFFGVVCMGLTLLVVNRDAFKVRLRDLWCFLGTGVLSLFFFNFCYFSAMQEMSLSLAAVLLYTAPVFVVIMSAVLFRERITPKKVVAVVVVLFGCAAMTGVLGGSLQASPFGLLLGLGSGFGYALYSIFSRFAMQRGYGPFTITFYTFVFSLVASVFFADFPTLMPVVMGSSAQGASGTVSVVGWGLLLGVVTCVIPYLLYTKGLEGVENGRASVTATFEMVVATIVSIVAFAEPFGLISLVGMVCVLGGIALMNLGKK